MDGNRSAGLRPGDVLKGKYEIQRLIGAGGMSRVFLAVDLQLLNKLWAVKEVDRRAKDPAGRPIEQSLAHEAAMLSRLSHPGIVGIADVAYTPDFIYVVMDYVEGQPLDQLVQREGPQPEADVRDWMLQVCSALSYLHGQNPPVVYRDMKPANIILRPDGYVKLVDLGVAREYKQAQAQDTVAFGTQGYAAPEQYGLDQSDARVDVYGLGATMWHLLTGEAPPMEFPLRSVRDANPRVSEGFADVIIPRCTCVDRDERYQSADELAADLEIYHELTKTFRAQQMRRVLAVVVPLLAAVLLVVLGFACLWVRAALIEGDYRAVSEEARALLEYQPEQARQRFLRAIELEGANEDAYWGLLEAYAVDAVLTEDEKQEFDALFVQHQPELVKRPGFGSLALHAGQINWLFYAYGDRDVNDADSADRASGVSGDDQALRLRAAHYYFQQASSFSESDAGNEWASSLEARYARMFLALADFSKHSTVYDRMVGADELAEGGAEADSYQAQWTALCELCELAQAFDTDSTMAVHAFDLALGRIEGLADRFIQASIPLAEIESRVRGIEKGLSQLDGRIKQVQRGTLAHAMARVPVVKRRLATLSQVKEG